MILFQTEVQVQSISAEQVSAFMINCTDAEYQRWWPGTHFLFHTEFRYPRQVGNIVVFDEFIGKTRIRFQAVVEQFESGKRIVWRLRRFVPLPARLTLTLQDIQGGIKIIHTLAVGFSGIGGILDPIFSLFIPKHFDRELDEHVKAEFLKLPELVGKTIR